MKGIINIIIALICLGTIIYHFIHQPEQEYLFGFAVSNLVFLLFWGFCLFSSILGIKRAYQKK